MFHPSRSIRTRVYVLVHATVALLVLLGVFVGVNWGRMPDGFAEFLAVRITVKNLIVTALFLLASAVSFRAFGLSRPEPSVPFWKELLRVTQACTVASVFALLFPLTSESGSFTGRVILYFLPVAIVSCLCGRFVARAFGDGITRAITGRRDLIIVGSDHRAAELYEDMCEPSHGYTQVLGFVDSPNGHLVSAAIRQQMLGTLDDLEGILMKQPVDEVLITLPAKSCYDQIQTAIRTCERIGVEAKYLSDVFELSVAKPTFELDGDAPVVSLKLVHEDYRRLLKRSMDILGAIVGLVIFGPLMFAIAVAIKLTSPGPATFTQERYGFHKRPFRVYKFRTMVPNAEQVLANHLASDSRLRIEWYQNHKLKNDPRVTRIGKILRKTSMDELPQLLNVLRGEMSLVGPRPIVDSEIQKYGESFALYRQMIPGLTGLWQISGRNNCSYQERVELDKHYVRNWSLWLDFRILMRTVAVLVTRKGAY